MKSMLFSGVLMISHFVSSQVEFYLDEVLVDQSVIQQAEINNQQTSVLAFKNVGIASVTWHIEQCQLNDDPNVNGSYVYFVKEFDVFGGIASPYDYVTMPCWEMDINNGWFIDLAIAERMMYTNSLEASGAGCEQFRYYVKEDSAIIDSIDVNYCAALSIPENESIIINVYPVPASDVVTIDIGKNDGSAKIFGSNGQLLLGKIQINGTKNISIVDFPSGIYTIQIIVEDRLIYKRFAKFD
jgi:hypothetical protein